MPLVWGCCFGHFSPPPLSPSGHHWLHGGGILNPQPFASSHLWYVFGLVRLLIQHYRWGEVIKPCQLVWGCCFGHFSPPPLSLSGHHWLHGGGIFEPATLC